MKQYVFLGIASLLLLASPTIFAADTADEEYGSEETYQVSGDDGNEFSEVSKPKKKKKKGSKKGKGKKGKKKGAKKKTTDFEFEDILQVSFDAQDESTELCADDSDDDGY